MPVAAPVAAALIMATATVGAAVITQKMAPGPPKVPKPTVNMAPQKAKELAPASNDVQEEAEKETQRAAAMEMQRRRASTRLSSGIRSQATSPLGTVNQLGG